VIDVGAAVKADIATVKGVADNVATDVDTIKHNVDKVFYTQTGFSIPAIKTLLQAEYNLPITGKDITLNGALLYLKQNGFIHHILHGIPHLLNIHLINYLNYKVMDVTQPQLLAGEADPSTLQANLDIIAERAWNWHSIL